MFNVNRTQPTTTVNSRSEEEKNAVWDIDIANMRRGDAPQRMGGGYLMWHSRSGQSGSETKKKSKSNSEVIIKNKRKVIYSIKKAIWVARAQQYGQRQKWRHVPRPRQRANERKRNTHGTDDCLIWSDCCCSHSPRSHTDLSSCDVWLQGFLPHCPCVCLVAHFMCSFFTATAGSFWNVIDACGDMGHWRCCSNERAHIFAPERNGINLLASVVSVYWGQ